MTAVQAQLLAFIRSYTAEHGFPPSYDEMRAELGFRTKSNIHRIVSLLAKRGVLTGMGQTRGLRVAEDLRCPKCGTTMEMHHR